MGLFKLLRIEVLNGGMVETYIWPFMERRRQILPERDKRKDLDRNRNGISGIQSDNERFIKVTARLGAFEEVDK